MRGKSDFRVEDHHLNNVREDKICEYFHPNTKEWDVHKVEQCFHTNDIQLILQTRIPQNRVRDRVAWMHSSNGFYTARSAYHFWFSKNHTMPEEFLSRGWNKLWNLNIPHKIKTFLWRFCRNTIPVRNRLRNKGIDVPIICPVCERDVEHLLHVFFDCSFASQCWQKTNFDPDVLNVDSAPSWLLTKLCVEGDDNIISIAQALWGIWFARNKLVWEKSKLSPSVVMDISSKNIKEWQEAMERKRERCNGAKSRGVQPRKEIKWEAPQPGWLKLNVDASLVPGTGSFAVGMVARDESGLFVAGKTLKVRGEVNVMEAEAYGVLETLKWVQEKEYKNVVIESDSLLVIDAINRETRYQLEVGDLLQACREKLNNRSDIRICHVKRHANNAAHLIARQPCLLDGFVVFMSPPNILLETLNSEISLT